jgi:hypothetical protein|tara:strand:+ start:414 stop:1130 length:717 start_codon:yes stop_codon:yes gene_type:complete
MAKRKEVSISLENLISANPHISENVLKILLANIETSASIFPMLERNHKKNGLVAVSALKAGVKESDKMPIWTEANCLFSGTEYPVHEYIIQTSTRLDMEHNKLDSYTQANRKVLGMAKRRDGEKGLQTFHVCPCYWLTAETVEKLTKLNEPTTDTKPKAKPKTKKEPVLTTPPNTDTKAQSKAENNAKLQTAREEFIALTESRNSFAEILGEDNEEVIRIDTDIEKLKSEVQKLAKQI